MTPMLTAASKRVAIANLDHRLTDAEQAYVTEHLIEAARVRKTSVAKVSEHVFQSIIEEAKLDANDSDLPVVEEITSRVTAHANCSHEATKAARAKCRRERARAAA